MNLAAPLDLGDATSIEDLCRQPSDTLASWLAAHTTMHEGTPPDTAAAFLFGALCWSLCKTVGQRWFETGLPPRLDRNVRVIARSEHWQESDEEGDHVVFAFEAAWPDTADRAETQAIERLAHDLETMLTPLVETLTAQTRLPKSAQWRLLGDSISGGLLEIGRERGESELAMERAGALLAQCRSPIANPQVGFIAIDASAPDGSQHRRWFRRRGGCCRYYKVEGGHYCTTCVLRDDESCTARLQDYVERQLLTAAS